MWDRRRLSTIQASVVCFTDSFVVLLNSYSWGEVRLSPLGTSATWHKVPTSYEGWWWVRSSRWNNGRGNRSTRRKPPELRHGPSIALPVLVKKDFFPTLPLPEGAVGTAWELLKPEKIVSSLKMYYLSLLPPLISFSFLHTPLPKNLNL
jgi:hypothetical protein